MRRLLSLLLLLTGVLHGAGFTEPSLTLYGRVIQSVGGTPQLRTSGDMTLVLRNTAAADNEVTLQATLRPVGNGAYSYAVPVPMKFDVPAYERGSFIEIKGAGAQMRVVSISIGGEPASLASLDDEILSITQDQRAGERRVDIFAGGSATDLDEDGMPDWWEELHGFNDNFAADAGEDADGDELTNLEEFHLGTDPSEANTEPRLLTRSVPLTSEGVAGVVFQYVDTDTPRKDISIRLTSIPDGIELRRDGVPVVIGESFTGPQLAAETLTLRHSSGTGGSLGLELFDGNSVLDTSTPDPDDRIPIAYPATMEIVVFDPAVPGGVQPLLWLDAHYLSLADGQAVASWTDRSGRLGTNSQPRSLVQGDVARQPVFSNSGSNPSVHFDGSGRHLLGSDSSLANSTRALFIYQEITPGTNTAAQAVLQSNNLDFTLNPFDGAVGYPGGAAFSVGTSVIRGFRSPSATAMLHAVRLTDDQGYALSQGFFDGSRATAPSTRPVVLPALGAKVRLNPSQPTQRIVETPFNGKVHEVLSYDRVLTEGFAGQVEAYLLSRWRQTVIWDYSDAFSGMEIDAGESASVIIGGFGNDKITAGPAGDIVSGGPGDNLLTGGEGADIFRYRTVDGGNDSIANFDIIEDRLDLSGRFLGKTGEVANFIELEPSVEIEDGAVLLMTRVKLFLNGSAPEPDQVITLTGLALSPADLGRLVGEGVIVAGDLVPGESVSLSPVALEVKDVPGRSLEIIVRRSGNSAHAEEVPLRFSGSATAWVDFDLAGAGGTLARPTAVFAQGESEASVFIVPIADALEENDETLGIAVVSRPRHYQFSGTEPLVTLRRSTWITVASSGSPLASDSGGQGTLTLTRNGDRTGAMQVDLEFSGDALEGVDYETLPPHVIFPNGSSTAIVAVKSLPSAGPGVKRLVISAAQSPADYVTVAPWSAEFLIVPGDPLALGGFAAWRATNDPAAASVPLAEYAEADRNNDGVSNFQDYLGGLGGMTLQLGNPKDLLEVSMPADTLDAGLVIERSTNLVDWAPAPGLSGSGVQFDEDRGFVRAFERVSPTIRPGKEFFRATAKYRGLSATPGLFTGAPLPVASSGAVTWRPSVMMDGGLLASGLGAGESTVLAASVSGPGTLGFEWHLAGNPGDRLVVKLDGAEIASLSPGESWEPGAVVIAAGDHRVSWEYSKTADNTSPVGAAGIRKIGWIIP